MKKYARGIKPGEDPFEGIETFTTPGGAIAIQSALAWIECKLLQVCDFHGDHELLIAQATDGAILRQRRLIHAPSRQRIPLLIRISSHA